jgi:hypothetical protein
MSDEAMKTAVKAAYRRLQKAVLTTAGSTGDHAMREALRKTLDELRRGIDDDPEWLDEVMRTAGDDDIPPHR